MSKHQPSPLREDLLRLLPVWTLVTGTALVVTLGMRVVGGWHLERAMAGNRNACAYADIHHAGASQRMKALLGEASKERLALGDLSRPSVGSLSGDPVLAEIREYLEKALALCPNHAASTRDMAIVEWYAGNEGEALYRLGRFEQLDGRHEEALFALRLAADAAPGDPRIPVAQAASLLELDRPGEALALVEGRTEELRAVENGPAVVGRLFVRLGRLAAAEPYLREALLRNSSDNATLLNAFFVFDGLSKEREGADFLMSLGEGGRRTIPATYDIAASLYRELRDHESEAEALEQALALFPNSAALRWRYALALNRLGRISAARDEVARAMEADPRFVLAQLAGGSFSGIDPRE